MTVNMEFGVIGLGRMGGNLVRQALEKGMKVAGFDKGEIAEDLLKLGLVAVKTQEELKENLTSPRAIFIYVPAGPIIDTIIDQLAAVLDKGDVIVDGGNSYWGDSIRRAKRLKEQGIHLVDLGTSGGVEGAREGACFMAGWGEQAMPRIGTVSRPLVRMGWQLEAWSVADGCVQHIS